MAANVEKMALIGQPSWHGLESVMPVGASLEDWRKVGGLQHRVEKTPVVYAADERVISSTDYYVLYRNDTKAALSVVGASYNVVQPTDIIDFFASLIRDNGYTMETAGSLAGGRKVWALARTGNEFSIAGTDVVKEYVLLATSYDKTLATTAKHTSVRVVCQNTLHVAINNSEPAVKVLHTNTFDSTKVKIELGLMNDEWCAFKEAAGIMHRIKLDVTQSARWYAELLTERDDITDDELIQMSGENRVLKDLMNVYSTAPGAEPTLWGVLNGATAFIDHVRGRSADTRLNSAWFGQGATLKALAWEKAMERVKVAA